MSQQGVGGVRWKSRGSEAEGPGCPSQIPICRTGGGGCVIGVSCTIKTTMNTHRP